jgi:hypothetical protein
MDGLLVPSLDYEPAKAYTRDVEVMKVDTFDEAVATPLRPGTPTTRRRGVGQAHKTPSDTSGTGD